MLNLIIGGARVFSGCGFIDVVNPDMVNEVKELIVQRGDSEYKTVIDPETGLITYVFVRKIEPEQPKPIYSPPISTEKISEKEEVLIFAPNAEYTRCMFNKHHGLVNLETLAQLSVITFIAYTTYKLLEYSDK